MSSICPSRPKTDKLDAVWLCKVAERGMIRPSFVPPPIRRLRDVTRYRVDLVGVRTAEKQREEKLLEDSRSHSVWWPATFSGSRGGK
ncbi:MAG: IS110 family transposase [Pseudonocardiaceae bacterium]